MPAFEGRYEVSSDGQIRSVDRRNSIGHRRSGKLLRTALSGRYLAVKLFKNGQRRHVRIHRLVLAAFRGVRYGLQSRHLNGNSRDNRVENLSWGTAQENADDQKRHGRVSAKLTKEKVMEIRKRYAAGESRFSLADEFLVTAGNIWLIIRRRSWKHIA